MPSTFKTNIIPGFNPDPSIVRVDDDYFLVTSSFEFFPALPIYHSKDLVNWKLIGHAMTRRSQLDMRTNEAGGGIFAPTLRYHKGRFYIACGAIYRCKPETFEFVDPRGFLVHTDNIFDSSSWSEPVFFDCLGIDQDIFFDDDDRAYLSLCQHIHPDDAVPGDGVKLGLHTGVYACEIEVSTGRCLSEPVFLRASTTRIQIAEGPHIYKHDGWYYLSTAEGGTDEDHQQWISRSRSVLGPYEVGPQNVNPMIYNGDHPEVRNTGHMDWVQGVDGRWWAVFLGVRPQGKDRDYLSQLGRETFLAPMEWVDGWPVVNNKQRIGLTCEVEGEPLPLVEELKSWRDDFELKELSLGWYFSRTPVKREYSLTDRSGSLALYGGPYRLDVDESPTMILRKQVQFSLDWSTELDFTPSRPEQEAGTTVWWSKWAYSSLGVRGVKQGEGVVGRELVFRTPNPNDTTYLETTFPVAPGPITMLVKARPLYYEFYYSQNGQTRKAGEMSSKLLRRSRPFDSVYTGTHLGLYAMGSRGKPCLNPAYFAFAQWETVAETNGVKRSRTPDCM